MDVRDPRLVGIWKQQRIPVIFRQQRPQPMLVRLPYAPDNHAWLREKGRRHPNWNLRYKCWETPTSWFDSLVHRALTRFGKCYVIQPHKQLQKCAPACWNALGFDCECSCMGKNHGSGHPEGHWREISDTFAFQWGPRQYACRLIVATGNRTRH